MKKNYLFGAALMALTWTSCTQDDSLNLVGEDNSVFTGEMEFVGSRTSLGEDNKISWVLEDDLSIFKKNNINRQYKVASIDNGKATFSYLDNVTPTTVEAISGNYAVYPYSEDNSITTDGTISAPIKAEYTYTDRTSFISSALLAATSDDTNFNFKNVQGYLRLRLCAEIPEDYTAVKSVTLTSTSKNLSGVAEITWSTDGIPSAVIKNDGAGHSLTVTLSTPQPLPSKTSGDYLELYVPVVPMTFNPDEVSLTINFEGNESYTKKNSSAITIARREVTGMKFIVGVEDNFTGDMEGFEEVLEVKDNNALADAIKNISDRTIALSENTDYGTVAAGTLKNVTIKGAEGAVMIFKTDENTKIENVTLQNVCFEYTGATADCGVVIDANAQIYNLVLEGCTFTGTEAKAGRGLSGLNNNASIVIKGCTFKDLGYPIYAWGGYKALTIEGCTYDNIKSWAIMPQSGFDGDLTVTGCTFKNCLGGGLIKAGTLTAGHTFTFTNNVITDCTIVGDHNWFQFNVSAGTSVISGNTKDGADWTPGVADGLK